MGIRNYIMNPANVRLINGAIRRALLYVRKGGGAVSGVLVVDNDAQIRDMLVGVLSHAGYQVTSAANGKEALAAFEAQPVDLVVTDICMPGLDGLETIAELRRQVPDLRIIAISDAAGPRSCLRAAESFGATRPLAKPIDAQLLLDTIGDISD
jgi:CheY-like chemotaxis protein